MCWINFAPPSFVPKVMDGLGSLTTEVKSIRNQGVAWASTLDQHLELLNRLCFLTAERFV